MTMRVIRAARDGSLEGRAVQRGGNCSHSLIAKRRNADDPEGPPADFIGLISRLALLAPQLPERAAVWNGKITFLMPDANRLSDPVTVCAELRCDIAQRHLLVDKRHDTVGDPLGKPRAPLQASVATCNRYRTAADHLIGFMDEAHPVAHAHEINATRFVVSLRIAQVAPREQSSRFFEVSC